MPHNTLLGLPRNIRVQISVATVTVHLCCCTMHTEGVLGTIFLRLRARLCNWSLVHLIEYMELWGSTNSARSDLVFGSETHIAYLSTKV